MAEQIRMPSLGQTTDEMRIITWLKHEGDAVKLGEPLLEVETDKATLEVEAAAAGTLLKILHHADEMVEAGIVIAYVGRQGEALPGEVLPAEQPEVATSQASPEPAVQPISGGVKATPVARRMAYENGIDLATVQPSGGKIEKRDVQAALNPIPARPRKALARPTARFLAMQHGININEVRGSGPDGLIEKLDVQALIDQRQQAEQSPQTPAVPATVQPPHDSKLATAVPRHRQIIAQRLTRSIQTIPQIRLTATADMTRARDLLTTQRAAGMTGLTYTHLILRAVAQALRQHPRVNQLWLEDGPQLLPLPRADVGMAIAADDNLLVATISEPDRMSLTQLIRLASAAVERGRRGTLSQADTAPTAITVSNLGMHGIDDFEAIVDPSQTAILAVGRVAEEVVVIDGGIRVVPRMKLNLSIDHRVVDGAAAAQFLKSIRENLEQTEV